MSRTQYWCGGPTRCPIETNSWYNPSFLHGPPPKFVVVSGDAQSGVVGQELATPLVVRVVDANGRPKLEHVRSPNDTQPTDEGIDAVAMWGSSSVDLFLVGGDGKIYHRAQ